MWSENKRIRNHKYIIFFRGFLGPRKLSCLFFLGFLLRENKWEVHFYRTIDLYELLALASADEESTKNRTRTTKSWPSLSQQKPFKRRMILCTLGQSLNHSEQPQKNARPHSELLPSLSFTLFFHFNPTTLQTMLSVTPSIPVTKVSPSGNSSLLPWNPRGNHSGLGQNNKSFIIFSAYCDCWVERWVIATHRGLLHSLPN